MKNGKKTFLKQIQMEQLLSTLNIQKTYLSSFSINENLGKQIATIHNLGFYSWIIKKTKEKILDGNFEKWKNIMVKKLDNKL